MEYTELLYDFVDGTTDVAQEQILFAALASHEDLRADLKQLLAMKTAVQHDTKAFNPPAESTLALFSTLGFTAPSVPTPVERVSFVSRAAKTISNASASILTGVIMSSVTALSMYFMMNNHGGNNTVKTVEKTSVGAPVLAAMTPSNNTNSISQSVRTITLPPTEIIKYIYLNTPANQANASAAPNSIPNSQAEPETETTDQTTTPIMTTDVRTLALAQSIPGGLKQLDYDAELMPSPLDKSSGGNIPRWTFELRRMDTHSPTEQTFISQTPLLNNLAFSALYSLNSRLSVGVEFAQEQSFQKFSAIDAENRLVYIEQHPTLNSIAGIVRYAPFELGKFQPIIQASAGTTSIGAFGRGLIGVQYFPETFVSFILSAEGNIQRFKNEQDMVFTTSKYGMSYGVSFHF